MKTIKLPFLLLLFSACHNGPGSSGAITKDEVYAYFKKQLDNNVAAYDYKNPVVTIENFSEDAPVPFGDNMVAYPVHIDWTRSYDDYNTHRVEHRKNEYDRFARNVDTGKWEIINGQNGEETIETTPIP